MHLVGYYLGFLLENHLVACGSFGFAQVSLLGLCLAVPRLDTTTSF